MKSRTLWHRLVFTLAFVTLARLTFATALLLIALQALKPEPDE